MSVESDTKFTKAMIDAMTLAEFEKLTPEQKIIIDIAQYAETEEYSKMWTAHNDGKREGLQEGIEQGIQQGREVSNKALSWVLKRKRRRTTRSKVRNSRKPNHDGSEHRANRTGDWFGYRASDRDSNPRDSDSE